jgi:hypothetical protein
MGHLPAVLAGNLPYRKEAAVVVAAPREQVFAYIDEAAHMAGHMDRPTWMMGGGHMELRTDACRGHRVGSRMTLNGRAFGIPLGVETVVVERRAPALKQWETVGEPRLIVIGRYRITITIDRAPRQSRIAIRIDYDLPRSRRGRIAKWLAGIYALWCVRQMSTDLVSAFEAGLPQRLAP